MTQSTPTKKTSLKKTNKNAAAVTVNQNTVTFRDFTSALLVVSLLVNIFILIGWLIMQVTTKYDLQVATMLFIR